MLVGDQLSEVVRGDYIWVFHFSGIARLSVGCSWRIISQGRIAFTDTDHGQKFGLPAPVDGVEECHRLLRGKCIQGVAVREDTGDLIIEFGDDTTLEALNNSAGYEAWQYGDKTGFYVVATGGGKLAIWGPLE